MRTALLLLRLALITVGVLVSFDACATAADHESWIHIGLTTKDEVIQRYGEPDLAIASPDGETVTYRPTASGRPPSLPEIPTAQTGPVGPILSQVQRINPGLGSTPMDAGAPTRPNRQMRIRYDARGIVRELLE
jgi:hypothetical protein